jgi:hypothetical protein
MESRADPPHPTTPNLVRRERFRRLLELAARGTAPAGHAPQRVLQHGPATGTGGGGLLHLYSLLYSVFCQFSISLLSIFSQSSVSLLSVSCSNQDAGDGRAPACPPARPCQHSTVSGLTTRCQPTTPPGRPGAQARAVRRAAIVRRPAFLSLLGFVFWAGPAGGCRALRAAVASRAGAPPFARGPSSLPVASRARVARGATPSSLRLAGRLLAIGDAAGARFEGPRHEGPRANHNRSSVRSFFIILKSHSNFGGGLRVEGFRVYQCKTLDPRRHAPQHGFHYGAVPSGRHAACLRAYGYLLPVPMGCGGCRRGAAGTGGLSPLDSLPFSEPSLSVIYR